MYKLSITVDNDVARALRTLPARNVSRFVNAAIKHELERWRLRDLLRDLEAELGPPDEAMMRDAAAEFDKASAAATSRASKPKAKATRRRAGPRR